MEASRTKNTKIYVQSNRQCAVIGCPIEIDLVRIGSSIWQLKIDVHLCQKHVSGSL